MRSREFVCSVFLAIGFISPVAAQEPPPTIQPQQDPQAVSLITKSLSAMGAIYSPNRMTLSQGTITALDGTTKPIRIETIGNDQVRNDIGNAEFAFVVKAGDAAITTKGSTYQLPYWTTAYHRPEHLPALSLMSDFQKMNFQAVYVGLENADGKSAHHLRLSLLTSENIPAEYQDLMSEFHVWIDATSFLVMKTRHFDFSPEAIQNRTPVDIVYSEYRTQDGALVPFHLTRYLDGQKQSEIAFTNISLLANIPASDFQKNVSGAY